MKILFTTLWLTAAFLATYGFIRLTHEPITDLIIKLSMPRTIICRFTPLPMPRYTIPAALLNSGLCLWLCMRGGLPGTRKLPD